MKRFDARKIGNNVKETPQGFLVIPAFTARTGLQKYRQADGTILTEYRPEEEVFSESSMASLRTAVVTNRHPVVMVNPDNAQEFMVGYTNGIVSQEDDGDEKYLATELVITHASAIDAIKKGRVELSNGYDVSLDFTPGKYKGENYDAIQRNIINNHIALVDRGRAGEKVCLKLDENDAILIDQEDTMKLKIGDKEFEVADEIGKAIKDEMATLAKAKGDADLAIEEMKKKMKDMEPMKEKCDELETEKSTLVAKVDSLESDLAKVKGERMDADKIDTLVKERISVLDSAKKILSKEEIAKLDSMENMEIKKSVIKANSPNVDEKKLDDASYVNARFDHIVESFDSNDSQTKEFGKKVADENKTKKDNNESEISSSEKARLDSMEKDLKASREPINKK